MMTLDDVRDYAAWFEYELCAECERDYDEHTLGVNPLGLPHVYCDNYDESLERE